MVWLRLLVEQLLRYPTAVPLIAYLVVVSYYDVRYREASDVVLFSGYPPVAVALIYAVVSGRVLLEELLLHGILATWVIGAMAAMVRMGFVGSGDLVIIGVVALGVPYVKWVSMFPFPAFAVAVVGGAVYVFAEAVANAVHNARRWSMFLRATAKCGVTAKVYYFFYGRVFTAEEFRARRFYFPLVDEYGSRFAARVGVEPLDPLAHSVRGDFVIATKGLPMAVELLVGTIVAYAFLVL